MKFEVFTRKSGFMISVKLNNVFSKNGYI